MKTEEFEQKLAAAFNNGTALVKKVSALLDELNAETNKDYNLLYQLCTTHYKVAQSGKENKITTPVKNRQLWFDSVDWLVDHLYWIDQASQTDIRFDEFSNGLILWWFKWMIAAIDEDPDISVQKINEFNEKMDEYFTEIFDLGHRSSYKIRVTQAIKMANHESIEVNLYHWLESAEHHFDDCWACQLDDIVRSYCFLNRYDKALIWAKEILNGTSNCEEVPNITNSLIAEAYFHTGQIEKAEEILAKGYPLIKKSPSFIRPIAEFMRLYKTMDMPKSAIDIYHDNKELIADCESLYEQMLFHIEASQLAVDTKDTHKKLAIELAQRFDERNGNHHYGLQL